MLWLFGRRKPKQDEVDAVRRRVAQMPRQQPRLAAAEVRIEASR